MSTVAALKASKAWGGLDRELDAWAVTGVRASLWVRDDDAIAATPALNRLSALSREAAIPVCVAVIPSLMEPTLAGALDLWPEATVVQHGFAHVSHSAAGEKKSRVQRAWHATGAPTGTDSGQDQALRDLRRSVRANVSSTLEPYSR